MTARRTVTGQAKKSRQKLWNCGLGVVYLLLAQTASAEAAKKNLVKHRASPKVQSERNCDDRYDD